MKTAVVPAAVACPLRRFPSEMRACMTTIGAIEGNIIAAIITTQAVSQKPRAPGSVPGPASMPAIRSPVTAQAIAASRKRPKISPTRTTSGSGGACLREADSIETSVVERLGAALHGPLWHLVGEHVLGGLAVDRVELDPEVAHLPGRPADAELRREPVGRVVHGRLAVTSIGPLDRLELELAVADRC